MKIWLPIATLSYSIYLWHHTLMSILGFTVFADVKKQIDNVGGNCQEVVKIGAWPLAELYTIGFVFALVFATLSYVFVEKPAIDARRVFKTKWNII